MVNTKPRILCIHGGGVSGKIFKCQMRHFIKSLAPHFNLVFADGPWACAKQDDAKQLYAHMGGCRRWANWLSEHPHVEFAEAVNSIEYSLMKAMKNDDGTGEWVGLLGFSQGAKLAFSILVENQLRSRKQQSYRPFTGVSWRFGIIVAGRAPPFALNSHTQKSQYYSHITPLSTKEEEDLSKDIVPPRLRTPTLHVHGLQDGGLELHRDLLELFTSTAHTRLIEMDGTHGIPIKTADVAKVTQGILDLSKVSNRKAIHL